MLPPRASSGHLQTRGRMPPQHGAAVAGAPGAGTARAGAPASPRPPARAGRGRRTPRARRPRRPAAPARPAGPPPAAPRGPCTGPARPFAALCLLPSETCEVSGSLTRVRTRLRLPGAQREPRSAHERLAYRRLPCGGPPTVRGRADRATAAWHEGQLRPRPASGHGAVRAVLHPQAPAARPAAPARAAPPTPPRSTTRGCRRTRGLSAGPAQRLNCRSCRSLAGAGCRWAVAPRARRARAAPCAASQPPHAGGACVRERRRAAAARVCGSPPRRSSKALPGASHDRKACCMTLCAALVEFQQGWLHVCAPLPHGRTPRRAARTSGSA